MNTEQAISTVLNLDKTLMILNNIKYDIECQVENIFLYKKVLFKDGTIGTIIELYTEEVNAPYHYKFLVQVDDEVYDFLYEVEDFVQFV